MSGFYSPKKSWEEYTDHEKEAAKWGLPAETFNLEEEEGKTKEFLERLDKEGVKGEKWVNACIAEAKQRGIPLHMIIPVN